MKERRLIGALLGLLNGIFSPLSFIGDDPQTNLSVPNLPNRLRISILNFKHKHTALLSDSGFQMSASRIPVQLRVPMTNPDAALGRGDLVDFVVYHSS